jgi:hypothetical protein
MQRASVCCQLDHGKSLISNPKGIKFLASDDDFLWNKLKAFVFV